MRAPSALVAIAWFGVAQPEFGSCACDELPDESRPLPIGEVECGDDLDCTGDPCEVGRCWAGVCMFRPVTDRDGDGAFPAPCGDDCNDIDDTVGPGAAEVCDAADEDCDGRIDEAAPATNAYLITSMAPSPTSVFLPADEGALLVHNGASDRDFVAHRFGPVRALEPPRGVGSFDTGVLAGARGNDGVYAVVVYAGTAQYALFTWSASEITIVRPAATVPGLEVGATSAFDVIAFGDTVAIAYDAGTRNVRIGIEGPDVPIGEVITPSDISFATDGTHLAVLDPSEDTLVFLDARGTVVARHPVPPTSRSRSITSGDARIYVATSDGTRSALTPVTRVAGAGTSVPLPVDGHAWIAYVDGLMVVAVENAFGTWDIFAVDPTTGALRASGLDLVAGTHLSAVRANGGIAVSAGRADVGFLQACGTLF